MHSPSRQPLIVWRKLYDWVVSSSMMKIDSFGPGDSGFLPGLAIVAVMLVALIPVGPVDAMTYSTTKQGDDVQGSVGPATTLCTYSDPSDCSEDHFQSGTSAHIGEHDNTEDTPWAFYEVALVAPKDCIGDYLSVEMRYQVNDVYHRGGTYTDHDIFVKLRDYGAGEYDLLDSTVDTSTSNGGGDYEYQGTLDFGTRGAGNTGNSKYWQYGHGEGFVSDSTREFSHGTIAGTGQQGLYLKDISGSQSSKIGLYITANPAESPENYHHHTRVEVDWINVHYDDEETAPANPDHPTFQWADESMWPDPGNPSGPTEIGWYNPLGSDVKVIFGEGGSDACGFSNIEYTWRSVSAGAPENGAVGTDVYPDDSGNSEFSGITVPSNSGSYLFWYRAVDDLGNKAAWDSAPAIDFDYTDPQLPPIPADPSWYNSTNPPTLAWSPASDSYSGVTDYQISQAGVGIIGSIDHSSQIGHYTFDIEPNTLVTGDNEFEIIARDDAKPSKNSVGESIVILYDDFSPQVNPPLADHASFQESGPVLVWSLPLSSEGIFESGVDYCYLTIDGSDVSSIPASECTSSEGSVTLPHLADGSHTLTITACDFAGNCESVLRNFRIDATPPSLSGASVSPSDSNTWFADSSIRVSANFSDHSTWGVGSGIDRVWHGFYLDGTEPSISELKEGNPAPSVCQTECLTHEFSSVDNVEDGSWVWFYVVKDEAGNEEIGHHSGLTKIDTTKPIFVNGPQLILTPSGNLSASWEAADTGSGLLGYFFAVDSCVFESPPTSQTSHSFVPNAEAHFICVMAIDLAGNEAIEITDSGDPSINCTKIMSGKEFQEQPKEIICRIIDDSTINLHENLGEVKRIELDGVDITTDYSKTAKEDEFKISFQPQEIGVHWLQINALDRYGRECVFIVEYMVIGRGVEVTYWGEGDWAVVDSETDYSISFHWDKVELSNFFREEMQIEGVNLDSLVDTPLEPYFTVIRSPQGEDPMNHVVRLVWKRSLEPSIGENTTFNFYVDDGWSMVNYSLTISVESCPSTHIHNLSTDQCESIPSSDEKNDFAESFRRIIFNNIPALALVSLVIIGVIYRFKDAELIEGKYADEFEDFQFDEEEQALGGEK